MKALPLEEYTASLGLPGAPRIKFIKGEDTKSLKNAPRRLQIVSSDEDDDEDGVAGGKKKKVKEPEVRTKYDRMFERKNQDVFTEHYTKLIYDEEAGDKDGDQTNDATNGEDDFLAVKRRYEVQEDEELDGQSRNDSGIQVKEATGGVRAVHIDGRAPLLIDSNRREKLLQSKKKLLKYKNPGKKLVYDDDGNAHEIYELENEEDFKKRGDAAEQRAKFLELETERARLADIRDKEIAKQKKREKKEQRRAKARAEREAAAKEDGDSPVAYLAPYEEAEGGDAMEDEMEENEIRPPSKKQKKARDDHHDTSDRKVKKKATKITFDEPAEMQTLEDLEAFASGLLG